MSPAAARNLALGISGCAAARERFEGFIASRRPLRLKSPQTYSMAGIIHGATRLPRRWNSVL